MSLFLIISLEDGITIKKVSKEQLLKYIQPDEYGDCYFGDGVTFLSEVPKVEDGHFITDLNTDFYKPALLIKGEIIVPKPKKVVVEYDIDE